MAAATNEPLGSNSPAKTPDSSNSDLRLAAAVVAKNRKATAEFVSLYADGLYAYVRRRLAPRLDRVDDVVQDVFVAALDNLKQFQGASSLQTWLLGIARHKVEDYYRRQFRDPDPVGDGIEDLVAGSEAPGLDESLDRSQLESKVRRTLEKLPETYSVALMWRYWEKQSARQIAEATGRTEKAVERILARARSKFKKEWDHE